MAKIVLVEDTPANLALATKLLRAAGHEVLSATSAADGVALTRKEHPDLVLMDLGLPDMDGTQAMEMIKEAHETKDVRVVAFTAYAMASDRALALASGFDGYLTKPIDFSQFASEVAGFLP
ncbi:MAG TPA: response regulator [Actinomycetales bacterium]|jgi:CheY-like chemotaxis protein|nr:response regulator [Actinomycetales bacterium]